MTIVAGFALAYLVVAFFVFPAGVIPRDVKVPNVTGLNYDDAVQRLEQAGFKGEQGEQRYNSSAPKLTVLEQSPPPGSREGIGAPVTLVVSGGQRMATVPTVTGLTKMEAQLLLEKAGFDVGDVTDAPSNVTTGIVISTRPAAGSQVSMPTTVSIVLSGGVASIQMPALIGRDVDAARQTLTQLGVRNIKIVWDPMALETRGAVVSQTPVQSATLPPGAEVTLRVAGDGRAP
ncbi:MAG: PASTA domain-containing protein [Gemmatimonadota bacterium]